MPSETIIVALIGLMGVVFTGLIGFLGTTYYKARGDQAELEMRFQRAALSFPEFVEEWDEIHTDIINMMDNTEIDRFLILRAWNGFLEPRWTTAMFQMRTDGQIPIAYVHFELDRDYVERLREITQGGYAHVVTKDLPHTSALRSIYDQEGVTEAYIAHIISLDGPIKGTKAQTYCSFATHSPNGVSEKTRTKCRILVSRMKGLAAGFEERVI